MRVIAMLARHDQEALFRGEFIHADAARVILTPFAELLAGKLSEKQEVRCSQEGCQ